MINYRYPEEKIVATHMATLLNDTKAQQIITAGEVKNAGEATHLSQFFWRMVECSAKETVQLPCEGSSEYWLEKIYNTFGGYLERSGYQDEWNAEIDNA